MSKEKMKSDRKATRPFPSHTLEEALAIAQAIQEKYAGKPIKRALLAGAVGFSAESSGYRVLLSSSYKYGLTEGTEHAVDVSLTTLGRRITKPTSQAEKEAALKEGALKPDLLGRIYKHYDNERLPSGQFFWNTLEQQFGVPAEHTQELEGLLMKNGKFTGLVQDAGGAPYVFLSGAGAAPSLSEEEAEPEEKERVALAPPHPPSAAPPAPPKPGWIFVAHGKNRTPLEQLKRVLDSFKVPYKVAVDEPHSGRPISEKVANIMRECSAGIFIFTADEEFYEKGGSPIYRPSENVVFELGAGSMQYGNKMVIFKQDGVSFPTDFRDLGYISFEMDRLDAKASELVKELIGFGILKVSVA